MKKTTVQNRRLSPRAQREKQHQQQQRRERESVMSLLKVFTRRTWKGGRRPFAVSPRAPLSPSSSSSQSSSRGGNGVGKSSSSSRRWDDDDDGKEIRRGKRFGTFASKGAGFERTTTRKPTQTTTGRGEDIDDSETMTKGRFFSAYADVLEKNPSSSASSNTNTRNGGLRQKSKYENILVPDPFSLVQKELQFKC